jgi:hypothetical protein
MSEQLTNCHDCGAKPGEVHQSGCDVEHCSVCGGQWIQCGHGKHDSRFARWTGLWPGSAEAAALGVDLNTFYAQGYHQVFFVKPKKA